MTRFYENHQEVSEYIESREGLDGRYLIEKLKKHLKPKSTVLELGMGAGKDLNILNETFQGTGSDFSQAFIDIYKQKTFESDLLLIDARTLETKRKFNCIYSNKVLHHLSFDELKNSFIKQKHILTANGFLFHTFWLGTRKKRFSQTFFNHYQIKTIQAMIEKNYKIIEYNKYTEINLDDSFYIILQLN